MNLSVVVTHRLELPPLLMQFMTAMIAVLEKGGELPRTNSPGAAGTTAPRPLPQPAAPAQFAAGDPARPAQTVASPAPVPAQGAVPAVPGKKKGRPSKADMEARKVAEAAAQAGSVAEQIPTVQPSAPIAAAPAPQPAPVAAPAAGLFALPQGSVTDPAVRADGAVNQASNNSVATADDVKAAMVELLYSPNGEAKALEILARNKLTEFSQAKPDQYGPLVSEMKAALRN